MDQIAAPAPRTRTGNALRRLGSVATVPRGVSMVLALAVLALSPVLQPRREGVLVVDEPSLHPLTVRPALLVAGVCALAVLAARRWRWPLYILSPAAWLTLGMWPPVAAAAYYAAAPRPVTADTTRPSRRCTHLSLYAAAAGVSIVVPYAWPGARMFPALVFWQYPLFGACVAGLMVGVPILVARWEATRLDLVAARRDRAERERGEQAARIDQARPKSGRASHGRCTMWWPIGSRSSWCTLGRWKSTPSMRAPPRSPL